MSLNNPKLFLWLLGILGMTACNNSSQNNESTVMAQSRFLLSVEELKAKMKSEKLRIIDLRKPEQFAKGHIPGSVNLYRNDLRDHENPVAGMAMKADALATKLGESGIGSEHELVLYDDRAHCEATRLWWMLYRYGHEKMQILDGGYQQWESSNSPVTAEITKYEPRTFSFGLENRESTLYAQKEDLIDALSDEHAQIIDCRSGDEYSGAVLKDGAFKAGRIPKSIHIDFWENVHTLADGSIVFKSKEELRDLYQSKAIDSNNSIFLYCQSGVRSSHTAFVLQELLGYKKVYNYDGSWIEWSADDRLPFQQEKIQ